MTHVVSFLLEFDKENTWSRLLLWGDIPFWNRLSTLAKWSRWLYLVGDEEERRDALSNETKMDQTARPFLTLQPVFQFCTCPLVLCNFQRNSLSYLNDSVTIFMHLNFWCHIEWLTSNCIRGIMLMASWSMLLRDLVIIHQYAKRSIT